MDGKVSKLASKAKFNAALKRNATSTLKGKQAAGKMGRVSKVDLATKADAPDSEFARVENEDDDGYDPWSDRRPGPEPLFSENPWS